MKQLVITVNGVALDIDNEHASKLLALVTEKRTIESVIKQCVNMGYYNLKHRLEVNEAFKQYRKEHPTK